MELPQCNNGARERGPRLCVMFLLGKGTRLTGVGVGSCLPNTLSCHLQLCGSRSFPKLLFRPALPAACEKQESKSEASRQEQEPEERKLPVCLRCRRVMSVRCLFVFL